MSLGFIADLKEQGVTYQPLLLIDIALVDGTELNVCSHALNVADGGFPYLGKDYQPRVLNPDKIVAQAMSSEGIDQPPTLTLKLSDPDKFLWSNYELPIGFNGAQCVVKFLLWDVGTQNFSTDFVTKYVGRCSGGQPDERTLTINTNSKVNLSQTQLPSMRIQKTCIWSFPATSAQRSDGANNDFSQFFECGYWPEGSGGNEVGNWSGSTTLTSSVSATDTTIPVAAAFIPNGGEESSAFVVGQGRTAYIGLEAVQIVDYNISGNRFFVQRGISGTTATTHASGATIGVPFTICNKTRQNCIARLGNPSDTTHCADGNILVDITGRGSGRGSMIQYQPPGMVKSRGYISNKWEEIINVSPETKYGDSIPLCYGATWVDAKIASQQGDANFTYMEILLCYGQIDYVYDVVINGERIPHGASDGRMSQVPSEQNGPTTGFWFTVNDGRRDGSITGLPPYNYQGDCYGSLAVLLVVVPRAVAEANSTPKASVRISGQAIRVYTNDTTFTRQVTSNPAWVVNDLLYWCGITPDEINIPSLIGVAAKNNQVINYTNILGDLVNTIEDERHGSGATKPYTRFDISLAIQNRKAAADIIRDIRMGSNMLILPNFEDGKLYFSFESTLADQQSAQAELNGHVATNATVPFISPLPDQSASQGYPVYSFDESNIARKDKSNDSTLAITQTSITQTPNIIAVQFQNAENKFNVDSETIDDVEAIGRVGIPINGSLGDCGVNTFDRSRRAAELRIAKTLRGNPRFSTDGQAIGDAGGTLLATFETSFRAIHVQVGQLISITHQKYFMQDWLFRVTSVGLAEGGKRMVFTASYHNDIWYFYQYGQKNAPLFTTPWGLANSRNPLIWCPNGEAPVANDSLFDPTDKSFTLSQSYSAARDGSTIASLTIGGSLPANQYAPRNPPFMTTQGSTAPTGGTIAGGFTMFFAVCAKTQSGSTYMLSSPSYIARVFIPAGTNTNTASFSIPKWALGTAGYVAFAGRYANKLCYQTDADATPSTITLTQFNESTWGIPDTQFDHLELPVRRIAYPGVWHAEVLSVTSTSITLASGGFTTNQWAGYDISLVARNDGNPLPIVNMRVASNTSNTLTVEVTSPQPSAHLEPGDTVVCRSLPTIGSDSNGNGTVTDANWINALNPPESVDLFGRRATIFHTINNVAVSGGVMTVTTADSHGYATNDVVMIGNVNGVVGANTTDAITVLSATTFSLNTAVGSGVYIGGGDVTRLTRGLPDVSGKVLRVFAGSGRGYSVRIASNTSTVLTIDGAFPPATTFDSSTRYWIEESAPDGIFESASMTNRLPMAPVFQSVNVANYAGQFLSVMGVVVDVGDIKSNTGLAPVRDICLTGNIAATTDDGVPPTPSFQLEVTKKDGSLGIFEIGFVTSDNVQSIINVDLSLFYYNLLGGTAPLTLAANITSSATTITVSGTHTPFVGEVIVVDAELMIVQSSSGGTYTVIRSVLASAPVSHTAGALIYPLKQLLISIPFEPGFFLDPVKVTNFERWEYLPEVFISAAQAVATNVHGPGMASTICYTDPADLLGQGLFTSQGGNNGIGTNCWLNGTLSVHSTVGGGLLLLTAPITNVVGWAATGGALKARVNQAPVGADIVIEVYVDATSTLWATLTIPNGQTDVVVQGVDLLGLAPLAVGTLLRVDLTQVGTTFPGSDLGFQVLFKAS